jgi:hypothetical protein
MRTSMSLLAIAVVLTVTPAYGALCMPPAAEPNNPARYIESLTEALSYGKEGLKRSEPSRTATGDSGAAGEIREFLRGRICPQRIQDSKC